MSMLILFLACSTTPPPADDSALAEAGADCISLSPSLDFGDVSVFSDGSATGSLLLTSACPTERLITATTLSSRSAVFSAGSLSGPIAPGESLSIPVVFTPAASAAHVATLTVTTDSRRLSAKLSGVGTAPAASVSPTTIDFGLSSIGCRHQEAITITNTGSEDLVVDGLTFAPDSADLTLSAGEAPYINGPLPWTIAPGGSAEVEVGYMASDEIDDAASVEIFSSDPEALILSVTASGQGVMYGSVMDRFLLSEPAPVDVLLAVNTSDSMADTAARLGEHFDAFVAGLSGLDYRVAILVEDSGMVYGAEPYISPALAGDAVGIAEEMLSGSEGAYAEMAFTLLSQGISQSGSWLRDEAPLHLIGVSDVEEKSGGTYSDFVGAFQDLKDDPRDIVVHGIGGDYPGGCDLADPYTGLYEATVSTGGVFRSICMDDWAEGLGALAEEVALDTLRSRLSLSESPYPESIVVTVEGIEQTTGWSYDEDGGVIVFDADHMPEAPATVLIEYITTGDCE